MSVLVFFIVVFTTTGFAQSPDSAKTKKVKEPKHYFMSTFYFDRYSTPERTLGASINNVNIQTISTAGVPVTISGNPNQSIDNRLKSYKFAQTSGGFFIPLYTKDYKKNDSSVVSNFHLLVTGNYLLASPQFSGISDHTIFKGGIGLRGIYNTGKKNIWFVDYSPFAIRDLSGTDKAVWRSVTTIVYDRIVSDNFSFRIGFAKTFLFGNKYRLPYLGFRVGKLNKSYLSVQFPRNITFSFPLGSKFRGSIYTKPMGGIYPFSNADSIYYKNDKSLQFGRYEMIGGLRLDYKPCKRFAFYASAGGVGKSSIAMYSLSSNKNDYKNLTYYFLKEKLSSTYFLNAGITIRLGNAKKVYNNRNMYEVFDINSTIDPGDNNTNPGNGDIPVQKKKVKNIDYKDVQDLIETQDLY